MAGLAWLLTDAAMDLHAADGHPERPDRRLAAAEGVRDAAGDRLIEAMVEPVGDADVLRVHDPGLVDSLRATEGAGGGWIDSDTYVVPGSLRAAWLAAGAVLQAARAAASGEAGVAFAAVRPPGHHAARSRAAGFCLINNVAVAVNGLRVGGIAGRVAIVDWDVHHGDGTQALLEDDPDVLYLSTHRWPFYPGTGHPAERRRHGTVHNRTLAAGDGDEEFVAAWVDGLLPALVDFEPRAIVVSAGYDGHRDDPLGGLGVTEAGYEVVAAALGRAAAGLGVPGVALALEGGYDLDAVRASVAATVRGLLAGMATAAADGRGDS